MPQALCGVILSSRRGLLAFLWSCVNVIAFVAFVLAIIFSARDLGLGGFNSSNNYNSNYDYDRDCDREGGEGGGEGEQNGNHNGCGSGDPEQGEQFFNYDMSNTRSKAMAFAALWTAALAALIGVFGTIILGFQSPTGEYYPCCASNVHKTSPIGLGSFIGALLMFANVTLVCAVLFGEYEAENYKSCNCDNDNDDDNGVNEEKTERAALAFSVMCIFLTAMYSGFAVLTYLSSSAVIEEIEADERLEGLYNTGNTQKGYIDQRFDVRPSAGIKQSNGSSVGLHNSFVPPTPVSPSAASNQHHYNPGMNNNLFEETSVA